MKITFLQTELKFSFFNFQEILKHLQLYDIRDIY